MGVEDEQGGGETFLGLGCTGEPGESWAKPGKGNAGPEATLNPNWSQ
jgi:hypothetical protein